MYTVVSPFPLLALSDMHRKSIEMYRFFNIMVNYLIPMGTLSAGVINFCAVT